MDWPKSKQMRENKTHRKTHTKKFLQILNCGTIIETKELNEL